MNASLVASTADAIAAYGFPVVVAAPMLASFATASRVAAANCILVGAEVNYTRPAALLLCCAAVAWIMLRVSSLDPKCSEYTARQYAPEESQGLAARYRPRERASNVIQKIAHLVLFPSFH